ncbi:MULTISPECIES: beta-galactosidase BglB [Paenibacillus]|uniref:Glycoside hydrolase family 105 protein n=1 Tax=Paenibacillus macerans TaxID=44252 RepID=A0A090YBQ0_PAEMA|nr:glycoside hydrolase family 88 protein [Paenibacillus macerans]KFM95914.1 glycosyl Hydrolase Family 88 family protein [Paenibacillus macerans]MCY7560518.1 glycoside hydrolase family 88 protein [Paenibacillus macerans]MEC0153299.1 glycoside hydrolase family 88 protein [Paenibacillus macerans]MEC0332593.1 glycoside hydrolase family 88 protein [Paenibacillus macerans]MUG24021.1 glycoside hydrolase family 105 protein [Paenibacillus macerans]
MLQERAIAKQEVVDSIHLLMNNLTEIKDQSGEFLLNFDGLIVDDKSWHVWNWPQGVGLYGIYKYWRLTNDQRALEIINEWFHARIREGAPPKNVNTMAPLLTLAFLYEDTGNRTYLPYLEDWAEWVMHDMPRTKEGGLQHMTYGPENKNQLWDDTLMMTVLPLAKIGKLLNKPEYLEEAKKQFLIHIKYLTDRKTGLWYHGWTFEGKHNYAEALWARGNCWITIAIPEMIEILELEKGDFLREFLIDTLNRQIEALADYQDESGLWHTLINDPTSYLEASATAGFAYGILKSVHKRYVSQEYKEAAHKAIRGIMAEINQEGALQKVSVGTGMGDTLEFYKGIRTTAMPYGQSLAVLCLSEYLHTYI